GRWMHSAASPRSSTTSNPTSSTRTSVSRCFRPERTRCPRGQAGLSGENPAHAGAVVDDGQSRRVVDDDLVGGPTGKEPTARLPRELPRPRPAQSQKGDTAAEIGNDRQYEREPVAAREVEDPTRRPRSGGRADATADRDHTEDRSELAPRKEVCGLGGDRGAAGTPGQAEEAGVQP